MTTLCSDGKTVAADGQETWGGECVVMNREKIKLVDGKVYGFTGTGAMLDPCIDWHRFKSAKPQLAPEVKGDLTWGLCVFEADHVCYYSNTAPYPAYYPYPFSIGAGCDYAMGAMLAGASPHEAIAIACKRNIHTGGAIKVLEVPCKPVVQQAAE